jgi:asparagine synthase (glutamine-hydrolysing)
MSAIVAVLSRSSGARAIAERLLEAVAFRGSTRALDVDANDAVALGARHDEDGRPFRGDGVRVIADARLDARSALAALLGTAPGASAAELIGRAYLRWNVDWPAHVLGDYAAAIWDERTQELVLARDALGVRSLYWTKDERGLRVATEMGPLARSRARVTPDRLQMALFLIDRHDEQPTTLLQGIHAVPAAHVVVLREDGAARAHRYWHAGGRESPHRDLDACAHELRAVFHEAVAARLRDAGPKIALEFSGGQDSTSVAAMAASILRTAPNAAQPIGVTLTFPGMECDETRYSRPFAAHAGLSLLEVDPLEAPELLRFDLPAHATADVHYHPTLAFKWLQLEKTRALGARVTLTGIGADQILHREQIAEAADALRRGDVRAIASTLRVDGAKSVARAMLQAFVPTCVRRRVVPIFPRASILAPHVAREVYDVLSARRERLERLPHRDLTQLMHLDSIEHELPVPLAALDRLAARAGSELRYPFLDRRVVESVLAMPHAVTAGRGDDFRKPLLRRAMGDLLSPGILDRRSTTHFNPFVARAIFECAGDPTHLLREGRVWEYRLLDEVVIRQMLENPTSTANLRRFVDWIALEIWLRSLESLGERHGTEP